MGKRIAFAGDVLLQPRQTMGGEATMNSARIQKAIEHRKITDNEWDDELERCWAELTEALTENIETAREFLLEDCTPEDYLYVSEVYDDVVFKTQSPEYIDLLRRSIDRFRLGLLTAKQPAPSSCIRRGHGLYRPDSHKHV